METRWDVFIAHYTEDTCFAEELFDQLVDQGLKPFVDKKQLKAGDNFLEVLDRAQRRSKITAFLLPQSKALTSHDGQYFAGEIVTALDLHREGNHRIVPILVTEKSWVPTPLAPFNRLSLDDERNFKPIAEALSELVEKPQMGMKQGAVLYGKVPEFSTMAGREREKVVDNLKREISGFDCSRTAIEYLEFHGGEFGLFLPSDGRPQSQREITEQALFWALAAMSHWSTKPWDLSIVVDWEACAWEERPPSVTGSSTFLYGNAISRARLLVEFSNWAALQVSREAINPLLEWDKEAFPQRLASKLKDSYVAFAEDAEIVIDELSFHDRHKTKHSVNTIYLEDSEGRVILGNKNKPPQKVWIEYRGKQEARKDTPFVKRLVAADNVCIIGVTNENLTRFLKDALEVRKGKFWSNLSIVFPSSDVLDRMIDQYSRNAKAQAINERRLQWEQGKKTVMSFLVGKGRKGSWECLEFPGNLAFIGQRYSHVNPKANPNESSIRIAPILPGSDYKSSYYMEVFENTQVYNQLSDSIEAIIQNSIPMVEWNIYGSWRQDGWTVKGLTPLKRRHLTQDASSQFTPCFPIVLIILHCIESPTRHLAILQERTPYNSSSDIESYSNISGWVTERDFFNGLGIEPSSQYSRELYTSIPLIDDRKAMDLLDDEVRPHFSLDNPVPDPDLVKIYKAAAIRELREELGIDDAIIDDLENKLVEQGDPLLLDREHERLIFRVYSLEITSGVLEHIRLSRPYSELHPKRLNEVIAIHEKNRCNKLLQKRFHEYFLPVYGKLGIT